METWAGSLWHAGRGRYRAFSVGTTIVKMKDESSFFLTLLVFRMWRFTTFSRSVYLKFQTFETLIQRFAKKLSYHKLNSKCIPEESETMKRRRFRHIPPEDGVKVPQFNGCAVYLGCIRETERLNNERGGRSGGWGGVGGVKESARVRGGKRVFVKAKGATRSSELRRMRRGNWGEGREGRGGREEKPLQWDGCTWVVNEHADPLIRLAN